MTGSDPRADDLDLDLPAALSAVEQARAAVMGWLPQPPASAAALYRIELVIEELVMNLVMHAATGGGAHRLRLRASCHEGLLHLAVEDDGTPFDPTQMPPPEAPRQLRDATPGGLGLTLVRKASRSLTYVRDGDWNRLVVALAMA